MCVNKQMSKGRSSDETDFLNKDIDLITNQKTTPEKNYCGNISTIIILLSDTSSRNFTTKLFQICTLTLNLENNIFPVVLSNEIYYNITVINKVVTKTV